MGFFSFCFLFSSIENLTRGLAIRLWIMSPGILCVFTWESDFNQDLVENTCVPCCITMHGRSIKYLFFNRKRHECPSCLR